MIYLLIDGYNLMYAMAKGPVLSLRKSRESLLKVLSHYQSQKRDERKILIVFDSTHEENLTDSRDKWGQVEIVYTDRRTNADDWIKHECEKHPTHYVVISNDLEVQHGAKLHRCITLSSTEFMKRLPAAQAIEQEENPYLEDKDDSEEIPLYPKVSTKKKGVAKKLPKKDRQKMSRLKNL